MIGVEKIKSIALDTRRDFENGRVLDEEIIEAALAFGGLYPIAYRSSDRSKRQEMIREGQLVVVGRTDIKVPLVNEKTFPKNHCDIATPVLAQRLTVAGALGDNTAEIIAGGCGEDTSATDPTSYYDNYHKFLGIGETIIGYDTIVDITADQFGRIFPSVYVGPLISPWTRYPRIEQYEY